MSHTENPGECAACGWETDELFEVQNMRIDRGPFSEPKHWTWHCQVCYSTLAGNVHNYPEQHPDQTAIASILAWGINYLAALIKEGQHGIDVSTLPGEDSTNREDG